MPCSKYTGMQSEYFIGADCRPRRPRLALVAGGYKFRYIKIRSELCGSSRGHALWQPDFLAIGHLLGTRLQINSSGMFALSPKRRSRIEDEVTVQKAPRIGSGPPTQYLVRIKSTRTNRNTKNVETRSEGRIGTGEERRTSVWVELSPCSCHSWTHNFRVNTPPRLSTTRHRQPVVSGATIHCEELVEKQLLCLCLAFDMPRVLLRVSGVCPREVRWWGLSRGPSRGPTRDLARWSVMRIIVIIVQPPPTIVSPFLTILSIPDWNS